jgi:hypothetical protein
MFVCVFVNQPLTDVTGKILPTDTDRRYFYRRSCNHPERFTFESAYHKDYYLSVVNGEAKLRKSTDPESDIDLHFRLWPALSGD